MKVWLSALIISMALLGGCRKAVFTNIEEPQSNSNDLNNGGGTGDGVGEPGDGSKDDLTGKKLVVTVPVTELPFGGKKTTATAKIDGVDEPVDWTVEDPKGKPIAEITDGGELTTPDKGTDPTIVRIIAISKKDPAIKGEIPLLLIPNDGKPELIVSVPVPEIKIGGNKVTAVAKLKDGTLNPPVKWSIMGPGMRDIGSIDPTTGVYTSPMSGTESFGIIVTAVLIADPTVTGSTNLTIIPITAADAELIVEVPSKEIRSGGKEMLATARLKDGTLNPPVTWSIVGPVGVPAGSIDATGMYRSPATAKDPIPVVITAALVANPNIKASVTITVIKDDQTFARCTKANKVFPIVADVYELPANSERLPLNWKAQRFKTTVCLDHYNVTPRDFTSGFPDVEGLVEWFGLTTRTSIIIPADGNYTFTIMSDDGAKLYIEDMVNPLVNNDGQKQAHEIATGSRYFKAGKYPVVLDYFQGPRFRIALLLYWQKPGDSVKTIVPPSAFE